MIQDRFPDDPQTCRDYGFDRAYTAENRCLLLGLFKGLIIHLDVSPKIIDKWQKEGTLVKEIKKAFEGIPRHAQGGYYPWFLQHQWVLDHTLAPPSGDENLAYQQLTRGWQYAGGPSSTTLEEIKAITATWPEHKQTCFALCTGLPFHWYPSPEYNGWLEFGFCACPDERMEGSVYRLYLELMERCSWSEIYAAYDSSSLVALFDSKGLKAERQKIPHLGDVLSGSPRVFKSVWYLKQTVGTEDGILVPSVAVDYGFVNCQGKSERLLLRECYKRFFQSVDGDPITLHNAAISGKTFECVGGVVKLKKKERKMMCRLMKNPYPVL